MTSQRAFRSCLTLTLLIFLLGTLPAADDSYAQQTPDVAAVKAATQAFYAALSARDVSAMQKVWADHPGIVNIGPRSKAPAIGWPALKKNFEGTFGNFAELNVTVEDLRIIVDDSTAWATAIEKVQRKSKTGETGAATNLGTNIFVKQKGQWRMVYHHASAMPK